MSDQAEKAQIISEVQPDGTTKVVKTKYESAYSPKISTITGEMPDIPQDADLSKFFTPKRVIELTAPDGTKQKFIYKRLSPAELLRDYGTVALITQEMIDISKGVTDAITSETPEEYLRNIQADTKIRKATIQNGILKPTITDEAYEQIDSEHLDILFEVISGGITSQTELVQHFRNRAE